METAVRIPHFSAHAGAAPEAPPSFASHATELHGGDQPAEWVHLLPSGSFTGFDGRGPYHAPDPEAIIRATREASRGRALPIDYGHALEAAGLAGAAAPAAGWIEDYEVRGGEVWGRVIWTREGGRRVGEREYRFLSPVFHHDAAGNVLWLARAGLTNRPNLVLAAIHSQCPGSGQEEEDQVADLKTIATALGLAESADEAAIVARCSTAVAAEGTRGKVAHALQLSPTATDDELVARITALATPDPSQYVPVAVHSRVAADLASARQKDTERAVDAAIAARKLSPAQRDWALAYHARDPEGFDTFVAAQPAILGDQDVSATGGGGGGAALSTTEKAVCAQLGVSEEAFAANREG